ncbi:MAG: hypothetical protein ONB30_12375 [candidate division KSB1 bacterium]|nr:hypothetical protein [candidate division KSB1 bacterium]
MKRTELILAMAAFSAVGGILTCSREKGSAVSEDLPASYCRDTPLWQTGVRLVPVLRMGSPEDSGGLEFGEVSDLALGMDGNLYVLDRALRRVLRLSTEGELLATIDLQFGDGPGEFRHPWSVAADHGGKVFLTDRVHQRVTTLDPKGRFLDSFALGFDPAALAVDSLGHHIYVSCWLASYRGPLIRVYSKTGKLLRKLCAQPPETQAVRFSGDGGAMSVAAGGDILFSFPYPYEIRRYTADGRLVLRFRRSLSWFRPPSFDEVRALVRDYAFVRGVGLLPDGKIAHVVGGREGEREFFFFLDLFDRDGTYLTSEPLEAYGLSFVRFLAVDRQGHLYFDYYEPYPYIVKYRLEPR